MKELLAGLAKMLYEFLLGRLSAPQGTDPATVQTAIVELGSGYDRQAEEDDQRRKIIEFMRSQKGKRYQLGIEVQPGHEADAAAWDCSEAVEAAYRLAGLLIPDGSNYQYDHCQAVKTPKAGDLGFLWSDKWGRIGHVMVCTGLGTVIHAMGGRGVVEDVQGWAEGHPRFRGWRRHPDFSRPPEDRA